jgi:hypothetical protein
MNPSIKCAEYQVLIVVKFIIVTMKILAINIGDKLCECLSVLMHIVLSFRNRKM